MQVDIQISDCEESWQHQLAIYHDYHNKYSRIYSPEAFFRLPYLLEKFAHSNLSLSELHDIENYFKTKIYNKEALLHYKELILTKAVPFILSKNEILHKLPIKHPLNLIIKLSGAMSGGSYNAKENIIKLSPQCVPQNFLPFLITHEFTHICVDDDVRKYQLSHKTKERLVSRICSELLNFDDFNPIRDEQTDKLITKDNLLNDYYSVLINLQKQSSAN